jgi:hypothetical protein
MTKNEIDSSLTNILSLNHRGYIRSRESTTLEFKETFDWGYRSRYAKIMASFANNKGGFILFGVKNAPREAIGLLDQRFEKREPEKISEYLKSLFGTTIEFTSGIFEVHEKEFGYIYVPELTSKPLICSKNDGDVLRDGEIYFRNGARTDRIDSQNLRQLVEEEKHKERLAWQKHIEKIAKIGVRDAALLNLKSGVLNGSTKSVIIDKALLDQIRFIKEGSFSEREGAPTLRIIGEIKGTGDVIEKTVNFEEIFYLTAGEMGEKLGFSGGKRSTSKQAVALANYYGFKNMEGFVHRFRRYTGYSDDAYHFLLKKMNAGEFLPERDDPNMKKIRRKN